MKIEGAVTVMISEYLFNLNEQPILLYGACAQHGDKTVGYTVATDMCRIVTPTRTLFITLLL